MERLWQLAQKLPALGAVSRDLIAKCISEDQGLGFFENIRQAAMYDYALPLHRESEIEGVLVTFYDASYIEK